MKQRRFQRKAFVDNGSSSKSIGAASSLSSGTRKKEEANRSRFARGVWCGRLVFVFILACTGALLGWGAHHLLSSAEKELMEQQFHVTARGALGKFQANFFRKTEAFEILQHMFERGYANAPWPFVTMAGFPHVVSSIIKAVDGCAMAYMPVVAPDQLEEFENFAYDWYNQSGYPEGLAHSSFGKGIWGSNKKLNNTDKRYHDTDNKYYTPVLQHSAGAYQKFLMMNFWTNPSKRASINATLQCIESRKNGHTDENIQCTSLADTYLHPKLGPISLGTQAITLPQDNTTVVGYIHSPVSWEWIMYEVDDSLNGMSFVLTSSHGDGWTWNVINGTAVLQGKGEEFFPDPYVVENGPLRESIVMNPQGLYSVDSAEFIITVVPTEDFCSSYYTKNPYVGMAGAILIIVLTSFFFGVYDWLVRKEFNARQELLKAKREFMRFISHEVRTPLNSVCMGLALLEEELKEKKDESDKETPNSEELLLLQSIQSNTQSAVDVLNDLLNYDKIEGGNLSLELELVDAWTLIATTVSEFKISAQSKEIQLVEKIDNPKAVPKRLQAVADPIRLVQVVRNLVSNAIKFTSKNGTITIQASWIEPQLGKMGAEQDVSLQQGGQVLVARYGHLELSVTDSGAGMTDAQLGKLFKSAGVQFNANTLQGGGGTGLGLYISKGIMEQHGGTLSVDSEGLNKGTTFTLTLPIYLDANEAAGKTEAVMAKRVTGSSSFQDPTETTLITSTGSTELYEDEAGPLRILTVDDSISNLKLLKRLLEKRGHHVTTAENGQDALNIVQQSLQDKEFIDVICIDNHMPVMDGPTAVKGMRDIGCDSFIVGITGNVLPEDIELFKSQGANAVLPKPFRIAQLEELQVEHSIVARSSQEQPVLDIEMGASVREC